MAIASLRAILAAALLAMLVVLVPPAPRPAGGTSCWSWSAAEKKLARLHNNARRRNDIRMLALDPELSRVARLHSREMARRDSLEHTPGDKLGKRVTRWRRLGENIAFAESARQAHKMFMDSPSHRAAILERRFSHFGVGIRRDDGGLWVTVVLSARRNPGTTLDMPC